MKLREVSAPKLAARARAGGGVGDCVICGESAGEKRNRAPESEAALARRRRTRSFDAGCGWGNPVRKLMVTARGERERRNVQNSKGRCVVLCVFLKGR